MEKLQVIQRKILTWEALERWLHVVRFKNERIVFTNGCFDVIHRGHIEYLARASDMADHLVVGLNTDASVKKLKGLSRPYLDEDSRSILLASLHFVSVVVLFDEDTPYNLISFIQPDILVKGGDYKTEEIVGYDIVQASGGEVLTIPLTPGYSSTRVIGKISESLS
jgi:rfaE bifunctional protein nucleotidyltransferase chain/domain